MSGALRHSRLLWLGIGLLAGAVIGSLWPHTPLHAVATDRSETIVLATGPVDDIVEAVFYLDSMTGILRAGVPSLRQGAGYQAMWEANVAADLAGVIQTVNAAVGRTGGAKGAPVQPAIQPPKTPRFIMVTGVMDLRQGSARLRPGRAVVYVAEANTGIVITYVLPWSQQMHVANQPLRMPMQLWVADQFPTAVIRAADQE